MLLCFTVCCYVLGYGGGFMERDEVVEYKERIDSDDDEYDEVSIPVLRLPCLQNYVGAQWLSGRVLDLRPRGRRFEPHRRHCVVVLEQDTFILA